MFIHEVERCANDGGVEGDKGGCIIGERIDEGQLIVEYGKTLEKGGYMEDAESMKVRSALFRQFSAIPTYSHSSLSGEMERGKYHSSKIFLLLTLPSVRNCIS